MGLFMFSTMVENTATSVSSGATSITLGNALAEEKDFIGYSSFLSGSSSIITALSSLTDYYNEYIASTEAYVESLSDEELASLLYGLEEKELYQDDAKVLEFAKKDK